ncbi:MAG: GIY-YIG nuclease family protein [bacterium]
MDTYKVDFQGYWRDINKKGIPNYSGIYIVYRSIYKEDKKVVGLKEIIYIGQAKDVCVRIATHDKQEEFKKYISDHEELCYACAEVSESDLDIVEKALIFMQQPKLNQDYKDKYYGESAIFHINGFCELLEYTNFSLKKQDD